MRTGFKISFSWFSVMNTTVFAIFTLACIFPFYYLFINTISNNDLSDKGLIMFVPQGIHFTNYEQVLKIPGLLTSIAVSVSRTVLGTLVTVAASAFLGYLFTKNAMWGRKFWYRFLVVTMYFNAGLIPWYLVMLHLGMTNNFLAYILPQAVSPFFIILVKTFVESTPAALQESAEMDGAGYLVIFYRIVVPLVKPILATITIFSAVTQWNMFTDTLFLITDSKLFTLQFILYRYMNEATSLAALMKSMQGSSGMNIANMVNPTTIRTTVSMFVVAPIVLVYPFFQRYFVKGILIGSVKG
ncbi:carbohydrate ABC transporter permease [Paenibacillus hexagrammi]|uniref:Carbohydrate ABC transporter permease n=1 Tax=Paenibacillus hexagrammi TaxID=2908839 RepID=A0ABY3SLW3_9BACL|nr:carbohydrate ABC transporter permease [Paenibacillus sp. YPD9-1]UJF34863.1 carbohydrate ABC transporter permease [Paenibacillus sp. YPD9-1]